MPRGTLKLLLAGPECVDFCKLRLLPDRASYKGPTTPPGQDPRPGLDGKYGMRSGRSLPGGGGAPHHSPWVVLTTHPGLARKSRVVNGKILQVERRGRDMHCHARAHVPCVFRHPPAARRPERPQPRAQCSPTPHSSIPAGRAWDSFRRRCEVNSLAHPRAHAELPCQAASALELNLPRALLLARRQRGGLARAQPRKRRAAHAKTQRRPELPAELRLQWGVCARHRTTETNRPFI